MDGVARRWMPLDAVMVWTMLDGVWDGVGQCRTVYFGTLKSYLKQPLPTIKLGNPLFGLFLFVEITKEMTPPLHIPIEFITPVGKVT